MKNKVLGSRSIRLRAAVIVTVIGFAVMALIACGEDATLSSIAITTQPTKIEYEIGDSLDLAGMVVTATYSDNTTETVSITAANVSGFDSSKAGKKPLTVNYEGKTAAFNVWVLLKVVSETSSYNASDSLTSKTENEYDSKGNRTKSSSYDASGTLTSYIEYEYDSKGNQTRQSNYGASGSLTAKYEREFDTKGNQTKQSNYGASGSLTDRYEYEYDTKGNLTKRNTYNTSGTLTNYVEYEYDTKGNLTKENQYNQAGFDFVLGMYIEYEYDTKGNQTKSSPYQGGTTSLGYVEREYDSKGNRTKSSSYDASGILTSYSVPTYISIRID